MKVKEITYRHRNDFHAIFKCEYCGAEEKKTTGYHDRNYYENVIPSMVCKECGKATNDPLIPPIRMGYLIFAFLLCACTQEQPITPTNYDIDLGIRQTVVGNHIGVTIEAIADLDITLATVKLNGTQVPTQVNYTAMKVPTQMVPMLPIVYDVTVGAPGNMLKATFTLPAVDTLIYLEY